MEPKSSQEQRVICLKIEKKDLSLVKCLLITGRTHQIRVHMKAIGHPVVGDFLLW